MDTEIVKSVAFDYISDDDPIFLKFIELHKAQLHANKVPDHLWKSLFMKLKCDVFDAGMFFTMFEIQYDDEDVGSNYRPLYTVQVSSKEPIDSENRNHVFLIDHAWTYKAPEAKVHLTETPGLLNRMAKLMGKSLESATVLDDVINTMWKYNLTYSLLNGKNVEDRLPLWYIMDEFGSAIQHSDGPNVKLMPFIYLPEGIVYSIMYPIKTIFKGEDVTRDFADGCVDINFRRANLLPWINDDLKDISFEQVEPSEEYFKYGCIFESLPNLSNLSKECNGNKFPPKLLPALKVYSDYSFINKYLIDPRFQCVSDQNEADILWLTSHFKEYLQFSEAFPNKFINQFPFESVVTVKDLLSIVCRRQIVEEQSNLSNLDTYPLWLPTTYNLKTELPKFVSYFQNREHQGLDNHWICKPWNLARSLDIHITNNLDCIIRLASSGPKIVQKYIDTPVLFKRPEIGFVKFDIRYIVLLKSVNPLDVYVYKHFFLRLANKSFALRDFDEYEKHFTVMNYNNDAPLCKILCDTFIQEFEVQNSFAKWETVEWEIFSMLRKVFEAATMKTPPCGIGESPQSRAVYAADVMLSKEMNDKICPKLLEINWTPDCQRACEYYPDFYNDIFAFLFLDEPKDTIIDLCHY